MIADLDETIKKLLVAELPIKNGEIDVKFDQPKREWSAKLTRPTINFFLYDVRENPTLRQHQWEKSGGGNGGSLNIARMKRTPYRVDCFYMLTTWASEPGDEHRLMSRCLMAFMRNPVIPDQFMVGGMQNQPFDLPARIAAHDKLTNPAEIWSALDNEMRPTVSYIITIAIDPWTEVTGPIVRTLTFRTGQADQLPRRRVLNPEALSSEMIHIGGTVRSKEDGRQPQSGLDVAIKGTGFVDRTDADGRFTLGGLPAGEYTLVVWPEKGKPKEKKITVPAADGDFDIEL
jgi:hypothetical protein